MKRRYLATAALLSICHIASGAAQPAQPQQATEAALSPAEVRTRIEAKVAADSRIMALLHQITDVHGPRLTGSPQLRAAQDWAAEILKSWELQDVHLEPWDFGHQGWSNELTEASVVAPYQAPINARALPWSPSTAGLVTTNAVLLLPPGLGAVSGRSAASSPDPASWAKPTPRAPVAMPTLAELTAYLNSMKSKVRGAAVLVGRAATPSHDFTPAPLRRSDAELLAFASGARPGRRSPEPVTPPQPGRLSPDEVDNIVAKFLLDNGAAARIVDSGEPQEAMRVQSVNSYGEVRQVPAVMIANADYGRIARVLEDDMPVQLRLNVRNRYHPQGRTNYNVLAELPGTDKADEVVMLGGHFDSWAAGTGATDNAAGSAVMMEALRLLKASGMRPRRTIRLALWSGEEQGIFGSQAYVAEHFGSAEHPKPDFAKFAGYVNLDSGTGIPRGATVFGPPDAAAFVANTMASFRDWGFTTAIASSARMLGGSDNGSFAVAGLPAIGLLQDPFGYGAFTHHTNFDTYEKLYEPDLRNAAIEVAVLVYMLATSDDALSRFQAGAMPMPGPVSPSPARLQPETRGTGQDRE
ncbi:M20/M25/M40 family metallo-hydrolase [Sphingomonas sp. dw_22]|uniref:M20/M25/M40 family metallo-hydrolase n=1 Tax=Sphingomonas sp. dw_22 TaxID=2721175 RepID=UPI001BD4B53F|nr:M20/M25/M40 family metallo-hydrolase [Sphingomonas sp. dw_22]